MLVMNLNILFFRLIICHPEKYFEVKNVTQEYLSTQKNNMEDY
jgi:hypothetical protein